jgi:ribose-phosphate pyrophosphokinase
MITVAGHQIKPDIFPDKTQQVWHLPAEVLQSGRIDWKYEGDHEIMTIMQLAELMQSPVLCVDFLPYGRQDKDVSNEACFGLECFIRILSVSNISRLLTVDAHSDKFKEICAKYDFPCVNIIPVREMTFAQEDSKSEVVCFPDKGAFTRYERYFKCPMVYCEKIRDQATSEILSLELRSSIDLTDKNVLIVDDIIDGGRTFVETAKLLKSAGAAKVFLYGSHALCSKGVDILHEAGIEAIYSCEGLKSNWLDNGIDLLYTSGGKVDTTNAN